MAVTRMNLIFITIFKFAFFVFVLWIESLFVFSVTVDSN